jgi:hypothetical protein
VRVRRAGDDEVVRHVLIVEHARTDANARADECVDRLSEIRERPLPANRRATSGLRRWGSPSVAGEEERLRLADDTGSRYGGQRREKLLYGLRQKQRAKPSPAVGTVSVVATPGSPAIAAATVPFPCVSKVTRASAIGPQSLETSTSICLGSGWPGATS